MDDIEVNPEQVVAEPECALVERPDLLPVPVDIKEPPQFRGLNRRNFSRAIYAHAALEQFQIEVRGIRGRLEQFMSFLDQDDTLTATAVLGRIASLNRRIARLASIVKFARSQLSAETVPIAILPSRHVFASTYRRLDELSLRELTDIQKEYGGLAHDVNNKLAAAMGNAQLMQMARDWAKLKERLNGVVAALEQADMEIHAALDKRELSNQNIGQILETLDGMKSTVSAKISVNMSAQADANDYSAVIGMAPSQFSRLVFNLTYNAQEAGATSMNVCVRVVRGRELVVSLKDNGPGFKGKKPLEASKESSVAAQKAGSASKGNGLTLCYGFCRKAGGTLHLEDENDATGAEWTIRLPLLKGRR